MKVLSICIPSYNMEKYINRSVDTLIVDEVLDKLEIIIVNDGSKDRTLEIANDYKQKYPNSIIVIDKENGHYGSCINAALKIATGKYFRVLDADDWFDSDALIKFVNAIENIDVDVVYTHYTTHDTYEQRIIPHKLGVECNQVLSLNKHKISSKCYHMHCLTYNTVFLHKINYTQTEGVCYSDVQYVYFPLCKAIHIYYIDISLYQYFIGREEQSISASSRIKNVTHFIPILNTIIHSELENCNINSKSLKSYYVFELTEQILIHSLLHRNIETTEEFTLRKSVLFLFDNTKELYLKLIRNKIIKLWYKYPYLYKFLKYPLKLYYSK